MLFAQSFTELPPVVTSNPWMTIFVVFVLAYLVGRKGIGKSYLPWLNPAPAPIPDAPKAAPSDAMAMQAYAPASLSRSEVRAMIQDAVPQTDPPMSSPKPSPANAAHDALQMAIDHPAQQEALAPVIAGLAADAAKKN